MQVSCTSSTNTNKQRHNSDERERRTSSHSAGLPRGLYDLAMLFVWCADNVANEINRTHSNREKRDKRKHNLFGGGGGGGGLIMFAATNEQTRIEIKQETRTYVSSC